jgi:hypothetical protein
MTQEGQPKRNALAWVVAAFAIIAVVVITASYFASADPDGLERVAEDEGFLDVAQDHPWSVIPDYVFPGLDDGPMATIVAGLIGVALVFLVVWGVGSLLARRRSGTPPEA